MDKMIVFSKFSTSRWKPSNFSNLLDKVYGKVKLLFATKFSENFHVSLTKSEFHSSKFASLLFKILKFDTNNDLYWYNPLLVSRIAFCVDPLE